MALKVELLESSFKLVAPKGEALVARFYERLFQKYPAVKPLFSGVSMKAQKKKLLASLVLVIQNLRHGEKLREALLDLGRKHVGYGAEAPHYDAVAENLLAVLAEFAGKAWTPQLQEAWTEALGAIKTIMLEGASQSTSEVDDSKTAEVAKAVEDANTPVSAVEQQMGFGTDANQFLTFTLGDENYGVDILKVQEIKGYTTVTRIPNTPESIQGVLNLRGTIVPIVDLRIKFGMEKKEATRLTVIVVVVIHDRVMGIVVDSVSDVLDIPTKDIQPSPQFGNDVDISFISGIGKCEDKLITLLDMERVTSVAEIARTASGAKTAQVAEAPKAAEALEVAKALEAAKSAASS